MLLAEGSNSCSTSSRFGSSSVFSNVTPVMLRPVEARDKPLLDRVLRGREHDRNRRCRCFGRERRDVVRRVEDRDAMRNQLGRQCTQQIISGGLCRPVFDRDIAAFNITGLGQPPEECGHGLGRRAVEEADHRHLRLLRPRRDRPSRGAAEKRDQLAPPDRHSITSSARASSVGGTSMPRSLAVCRLMTSSNAAARTTGRSAGFSPLRMRPV